MRLIAMAAIPALCLAVPATAGPNPKGEAELAKLLEGRVAEAPVSCIRSWSSSDMKTIDGTAIVFGRGKVIYVNRTDDPSSINDRDALLVKKFGDAGRLCDSDVVTKFDRSARFYTGNVFLSEFIPYRRVK